MTVAIGQQKDGKLFSHRLRYGDCHSWYCALKYAVDKYSCFSIEQHLQIVPDGQLTIGLTADGASGIEQLFTDIVWHITSENPGNHRKETIKLMLSGTNNPFLD